MLDYLVSCFVVVGGDAGVDIAVLVCIFLAWLLSRGCWSTLLDYLVSCFVVVGGDAGVDIVVLVCIFSGVAIVARMLEYLA